MSKIVVSVVAILFAIPALLCAAGGGGVHWGYSGEGSPDKWGSLAPEFAACDQGRMQSPINIVATNEADLPVIETMYQPTPVFTLNNGHTIQLTYSPGSSMQIDGREYLLRQIHFHAPSENRINGRSYPMEAHFVHISEQGELAVIGVMFVVGRPNPVLASLFDRIPSLPGSDLIQSSKLVNAADLLPPFRDYYTFAGSLTTPPCSEGVLWLVMQDPVEASMGQIATFQRVMGGPNNRPVQPSNDRKVLQ